jgi:uncharacterized protein
MDRELLEAIKARAEAHFANAPGSHDWSHTERVRRLCQHIGAREGADLEIVEIAALLHDIGRDAQDRARGRVCHAEVGSRRARRLLTEVGLDAQRIERVLHCIESHRFRGQQRPQTKEAQVLFDADKLDSIGAVGIGRAFLFAGEVGAKVHNGGIDLQQTHSYSKEDTAYREFSVKLRRVKDHMLTAEGRRIAVGRHRFMERFFQRLQEEVEGKL